MRQLLIIILYLSCITKAAFAQEILVYSTSFEIDSSKYCKHSTIVNGYDTLGLDFYNYYPDMFNAIGTPDIFSPCDSFWYHISETDSLRMHYKNGWPQNFLGFQYPHYGNNYAGFLSYTYPINNNFRVSNDTIIINNI